MSEDLDSRRYSHSAKFERRTQILVKLSFRELCDSNLFVLRCSDKMAISLS